MGDDPYDFEIAIPSATQTQTSAPNYAARQYSGDDSNSDGSSVSVSASDDGSDGESFATKKPALKQPVAQAARTTATASGGSGSSALDKAKSFLSKYSIKAVETKATSQASARSRQRVELSMDDSMEFSHDSNSDSNSEDVDEAPKVKSKSNARATTPAAAASRSSKRVSLSDSSNYGGDSVDSDGSAKRPKQATVSLQQQQQQFTRTSTAKSASAYDAAARDGTSSKSDDDDDDNAIASFMDESNDSEPPPFTFPPSATAAVSRISVPTVKPIETASTVARRTDDDSGSVASSTSDYVESVDADDDSGAPPSVTQAVMTRQSAAVSESSAYEEEDFDEESGVAPTAVEHTVAPSSLRPDEAESLKPSEPNFDYSMDFSDDFGDADRGDSHDAGVTPSTTTTPTLSAPQVSESHDSDASERSELLESSRSEASGSSETQDQDLTSEPSSRTAGVAAAEPQSEAAPEPSKSAMAQTLLAPPLATANTASLSDSEATRPCSLKTAVAAAVAPTVSAFAPQDAAVALKEASAKTETTTASKTEQLQPAALAAANAQSSTRSRVQIVREYEQPARMSVEMKDASTQFTGNHAGVQADLTPDGMHSIVASAARAPPPSPVPRTTPSPVPRTTPPPTPPLPERSAPQSSESLPQYSNSPTPATPPPPPAPTGLGLGLESLGYSMDALRLPTTAATTSIYRQQLLALQQQIQSKKRATERLVRERMTFQYSTLRSTERFLASNRPEKLELWEALMRVDPSLSERRARAIAQLAAENAAA